MLFVKQVYVNQKFWMEKSDGKKETERDIYTSDVQTRA